MSPLKEQLDHLDNEITAMHTAMQKMQLAFNTEADPDLQVTRRDRAAHAGITGWLNRYKGDYFPSENEQKLIAVFAYALADKTEEVR